MIEVKADALEESFDGVEMPPVVMRPVLAGGAARGSGFGGYLRSGSTVEMKSFNATSGDAGGYALPSEIDAVIDRTLAAISPIRGVANVVKVGSAGYRKLVTTGGTPSGWAAETDARSETATPVFNEIAPPMGELYANPSASQAMLDDAQFDVEAWLAEEIATEFAHAEGSAFVGGNGTNRPKGFLSATMSAAGDASRAFGSLQYVPSGAAGDFAANPQDKLIDLVQTLRAPYRQGAVWVMNAATLARIRKFKTSDGAFLWAPGMVAGQPATLLGYPVIESEDTRASVATRCDSSGAMVNAAIDVARFDYDPASHAPRGLLVEPDASNLALNSQDWTQASWTRSSANITATRLVESSSTAVMTVQMAVALMRCAAARGRGSSANW